jgi:hypothetical protein
MAGPSLHGPRTLVQERRFSRSENFFLSFFFFFFFWGPALLRRVLALCSKNNIWLKCHVVI